MICRGVIGDSPSLPFIIHKKIIPGTLYLIHEIIMARFSFEVGLFIVQRKRIIFNHEVAADLVILPRYPGCLEYGGPVFVGGKRN